MRLYDTAKREIEEFVPDKNVSLYVCGITPYDATHLGHAATYLTYDLLIRRLRDLGSSVKYVRNITDVDDSILGKAKELGVPYLELADKEVAQFRNDMDALNMIVPDVEPRATEHISEMIDAISLLLTDGFAYQVDGFVYFDISKFGAFGELSHYSPNHMLCLARARGGKPDDPLRKQPLDFVLWQPAAEGEPSWNAPFGSGRPGWHIECSVMSMSYLGETIDIHGGGTDLIFPHHECETAQSQSLTGKPFVRHWMHSSMVSYEGEKMSKSLGNLVFVGDLVASHDPRAVRLALMRHHYSDGFEWFDTDIANADAQLQRLQAAVKETSGPDPRPFYSEVRAALDNNLNAPKATEVLGDFADAILSGGDDKSSPDELRKLSSLVGIDL